MNISFTTGYNLNVSRWKAVCLHESAAAPVRGSAHTGSAQRESVRCAELHPSAHFHFLFQKKETFKSLFSAMKQELR